jgi:bifunctional non-homologous end joining protein LigD
MSDGTAAGYGGRMEPARERDRERGRTEPARERERDRGPTEPARERERDRAGDRLRDYRAKRDFAATREPAPGDGAAPAPPPSGAAPRFVIQCHDASHLHWDLRLERDGTLASWALPRGVPLDPKDHRPAVPTEDHPLDYLDFEGEIPQGSYGAGTMTVWDRGTYEPLHWSERKVEVALHGEQVQGRYGLHPIGKDAWAIHRLDPPTDPHREPLPQHLAPMLARPGELPPAHEDERWAYEVKWDGVRALLWSDHGHVRIESRTQREIARRYPEVRALGRALGGHEALLDGELVAFGPDGRPSFERLQGRMNLEGEAQIRRAARAQPVTYAIFDLLHLDGRSLCAVPYEERRRLLDALALEGPAWRTPRAQLGGGEALLRATREQGLEGIVAKRRDSCYEPGRRSGAWRKVRNRNRQELVVGGWTPGEGKRAGRPGSLLLGVRERPGGPLRYAGKVGSGFTEQMLDELQRRLAPLKRSRSPFAPGGAQVPRDARFVEPRLVAEVEFGEWTREGVVRQAAFKGLRDDKPAGDVVREGAGGADAPDPRAPEAVFEAVQRLDSRDDAFEAQLDGRTLRITNWDKVLFPQTSFTKGDLIAYYVRIAPTLLGHLRDRPLTLRRWPDGVGAKPFFEKHSPAHRPEWAQTASVWSERERRRIDYMVASEPAALAWIGNQAAIELHPSLSLARALERPTAVVFDLDPGAPAGLEQCAEVALVLCGLFERLGLQSVVKTSGGKGLQVYVPLGEDGPTYERTKPFARRVATLLEQRLPELVVSRMTKRLRGGRVLVDWSQNDEHKTTVAAYSVRGRERPTVSTPLTWDELRAAHAAGRAEQLSFETGDVLRRVDEQGDLFAPLLGTRQQLPEL